MDDLGSHMRCAGCGTQVPADEPLPLVCPRAEELVDVDHVLGAQLELGSSSFPNDREQDPFVRFRRLFHSYRLARRSGMDDVDYVALVRELGDQVYAVDGRRFHTTPYLKNDELGVWIKNETVQPSGSHKSRHLMGIAIHLAVLDRLGLAANSADRPLAIASCGNAALAAAVIAKAADRRLQVFVPPSAAPSVLDRLDELGAERIVCERSPTLPAGDPCYHRYRDAVKAGALPFACQGNENGLTIAGGMTLAWELLTQHGEVGERPLDRVLIQVGGGALASSFGQGMNIAAELGVIDREPTLHAVQTCNAHPLWRAWDRWRATGQSISYAATHRSQFMEPWPDEPKSLAYGILDDETYDWVSILSALDRTGGSVVRVREEQIAKAHKHGRAATGINVCTTGVAGLAGLFELRDTREVAPGEEVAVLFTGTHR